MMWARNVTRRYQTTNAFTVLVGLLEGNRTKGKSSSRWENARLKLILQKWVLGRGLDLTDSEKLHWRGLL